jgi:pyridoxamine 5'-phosphate oxidase
MGGPWRQPFETALERNAPQTEVQVGTVSPEGVPAVRTVLLRGVTPDGLPYFFTDLRSRKANHLAENPKIALHAWFPKTREQFRLTGRASVHGWRSEGAWAELRRQGWAVLDVDERRLYVGPPPGRTHVEMREIATPPAPPQEFVLVTVEVTEADWLSEGPPKTRAGFRLLGSGWAQEWLNP